MNSIPKIPIGFYHSWWHISAEHSTEEEREKYREDPNLQQWIKHEAEIRNILKSQDFTEEHRKEIARLIGLIRFPYMRTSVDSCIEDLKKLAEDFRSFGGTHTAKVCERYRALLLCIQNPSTGVQSFIQNDQQSDEWEKYNLLPLKHSLAIIAPERQEAWLVQYLSNIWRQNPFFSWHVEIKLKEVQPTKMELEELKNLNDDNLNAFINHLILKPEVSRKEPINGQEFDFTYMFSSMQKRLPKEEQEKIQSLLDEQVAKETMVQKDLHRLFEHCPKTLLSPEEMKHRYENEKLSCSDVLYLEAAIQKAFFRKEGELRYLNFLLALYYTYDRSAKNTFIFWPLFTKEILEQLSLQQSSKWWKWREEELVAQFHYRHPLIQDGMIPCMEAQLSLEQGDKERTLPHLQNTLKTESPKWQVQAFLLWKDILEDKKSDHELIGFFIKMTKEFFIPNDAPLSIVLLLSLRIHQLKYKQISEQDFLNSWNEHQHHAEVILVNRIRLLYDAHPFITDMTSFTPIIKNLCANIDIDKTPSFLLMMLAELLHRIGKSKEALPLAQHAYDMGDEKFDLFFHLLLSNGKIDEARKRVDELYCSDEEKDKYRDAIDSYKEKRKKAGFEYFASSITQTLTDPITQPFFKTKINLENHNINICIPSVDDINTENIAQTLAVMLHVLNKQTLPRNYKDILFACEDPIDRLEQGEGKGFLWMLLATCWMDNPNDHFHPEPNWPHATSLMEKSLALIPQNRPVYGDVLGYTGRAYRYNPEGNVQKNKKKAIQLWEKKISLFGEDPNTQVNIAEALQSLGIISKYQLKEQLMQQRKMQRDSLTGDSLLIPVLVESNNKESLQEAVHLFEKHPFKERLPVQEFLRLENWYALAKSDLMYWHHDLYEEAIANYFRYFSSINQAKYPELWATAGHNMTRLYLQKFSNFDKGLRLQKKVIDVRKSLGNTKHIWETIFLPVDLLSISNSKWAQTFFRSTIQAWGKEALEFAKKLGPTEQIFVHLALLRIATKKEAEEIWDTLDSFRQDFYFDTSLMQELLKSFPFVLSKAQNSEERKKWVLRRVGIKFRMLLHIHKPIEIPTNLWIKWKQRYKNTNAAQNLDLITEIQKHEPDFLSIHPNESLPNLPQNTCILGRVPIFGKSFVFLFEQNHFDMKETEEIHSMIGDECTQIIWVSTSKGMEENPQLLFPNIPCSISMQITSPPLCSTTQSDQLLICMANHKEKPILGFSKAMNNLLETFPKAISLISDKERYGTQVGASCDKAAQKEDFLRQLMNVDSCILLCHGEYHEDGVSIFELCSPDGNKILLRTDEIELYPHAFRNKNFFLLSCSSGKIEQREEKPIGLAGSLLCCGANQIIAPTLPISVDLAIEMVLTFFSLNPDHSSWSKTLFESKKKLAVQNLSSSGYLGKKKGKPTPQKRSSEIDSFIHYIR